jgi:SNF2 family DNA or RNA helicase
MFQAFEHEKLSNSLISKQSLAYKTQKISDFLKKIDKLSGKISSLEGKTVKTASNLLQINYLKEELEATEELMKALLARDGGTEGGGDVGTVTDTGEVAHITRDDLIRKGYLNPLDTQDILQETAVNPTNDNVFLQDNPGDKDYLDDGDFDYYQTRYFKYALEKYKERTGHDQTPPTDILRDEEFQSNSPDHTIGRLRVPSTIYSHLFEYQKTCLRWFYELYNQHVGGVLGDGWALFNIRNG